MRADGAPSSGLVTLTPVATRDSAALNLTVIAAPVVVTLDGAGKFARIIMAGNDPELGALLYLRIDELIDGESRSYTILVPESAAETGLDLADRESLEPVQEMAGYVLFSSIGVTVAPLVGGLVPVVHLPPGSGGSGVTDHGLLTGLADDDHPHYLTQVRGDERYYTETELNILLTAKAATGHAHSYQPLDVDLTDIAALAPADDSLVQRKAGAWSGRTPAQVKIDLRSPVVALTDAATIGIDATLGDIFDATLGGNRTLGNPTGAVNGQKLLFRIKQDGTGGRTLAFGTKYRFGSDLSSVVLSTVAGKLDRIGVEYSFADDKFDVIALMRGY